MMIGTTGDIRCVLYLRVSSRKQVDGVSLEDQEHLGRAYAARMGWIVTRVYVEPGRSAFTENLAKRVAFQELLADARAGLLDVVLVYKLNRFARNVPVQYDAAAQLERYGVQIASVTEPIERKTASGRATFGMLAVMAQLQSDQLSEKMRDTRLAQTRSGRHVGPLPIGFDRQNGVLVANDRAAMPQLAFALYATRHHSYVTVADSLNAAGFRMPNGGLFTKFQVEEMLKNPVYVGRVRCKGQEFPGAHKPLIEQEVWDAVQAEIGRRAAHANHDPHAASRPALLSGLVYCSNCGARMWYTPGRGGSSNYDYYVCSGRSTHARDPRCNLPFVQARAAEAHVLASLAVLTLDQELLAQAADELANLAAVDRPQPPVDRIAIEAKIKRLARLYEDGFKTEAEYARERDALRAQLATEGAPIGKPNRSSAVALLADVPQLLRRATLDERRSVLEEVLDVIYLTPHQAMAVRPVESYAPLLQAAYDSYHILSQTWHHILSENTSFVYHYCQLGKHRWHHILSESQNWRAYCVRKLHYTSIAMNSCPHDYHGYHGDIKGQHSLTTQAS